MQKIEISSRTIVFTVFFLILLRFLWLIKDLIFSLFIAFIIMSALKPFVLFLIKRKVPKIIAAFTTYIIFLSFIIFFSILIFPPLVGEGTSLFRNLPSIIENISPSLIQLNVDFSQLIFNLSNQFLNLAKNIFTNAIFVISTLVFSFYFLINQDLVDTIVGRFFEESKTRQIINIISKAEQRMGAWVWGELTLMMIVGIMTFIGLNLIGIRYALALAVLAGVLEVVPNLGPTLSAVPAVLIGFSQSYFLGFAILALYFLVQQLENNLVVPIVMRKAVGLNPVIILIALIVGGKLAGVVGVLLAIPTTLFVETILIEVLKMQRTAVNLR